MKSRIEELAAKVTLKAATVTAAARFLAFSSLAAPIPVIPMWVQNWANRLDQVPLPLVFVPLTMPVSRLQGEQTRETVHKRHDELHARLTKADA